MDTSSEIRSEVRRLSHLILINLRKNLNSGSNNCLVHRLTFHFLASSYQISLSWACARDWRLSQAAARFTENTPQAPVRGPRDGTSPPLASTRSWTRCASTRRVQTFSELGTRTTCSLDHHRLSRLSSCGSAFRPSRFPRRRAPSSSSGIRRGDPRLGRVPLSRQTSIATAAVTAALADAHHAVGMSGANDRRRRWACRSLCARHVACQARAGSSSRMASGSSSPHATRPRDEVAMGTAQHDVTAGNRTNWRTWVVH